MTTLSPTLSIIISIAFIGFLFLITLKLIKKNKTNNNNLNKKITFHEKSANLNHSEKRKYQRVNKILNIKIKINPDEVVNAETKDISLTGAFILSNLILNINENIQVNLYKDNYEKNNWLDAKVIWSNTHLPQNNIIISGFGIKFVNIREKEKEFLNQIIQN